MPKYRFNTRVKFKDQIREIGSEVDCARDEILECLERGWAEPAGKSKGSSSDSDDK